MEHYILEIGLLGLIVLQQLQFKFFVDDYEDYRNRANLYMAGLQTIAEKPEKTPGM